MHNVPFLHPLAKRILFQIDRLISLFFIPRLVSILAHDSRRIIAENSIQTRNRSFDRTVQKINAKRMLFHANANEFLVLSRDFQTMLECKRDRAELEKIVAGKRARKAIIIIEENH